MKTDLFQSCGHCWVFQIFWHIECSTFTASPFRIWKSSTGIPSPPLALFVVMLPKAHLTSRSRMSGSRWVITPLWLSWWWRSFCTVLLCVPAPSSSYLLLPTVHSDTERIKWDKEARAFVCCEVLSGSQAALLVHRRKEVDGSPCHGLCRDCSPVMIIKSFKSFKCWWAQSTVP